MAQRADQAPWLVVGLGNPGPTYQNTRHNVGFDVVELIAESAGQTWSTSKFQAMTARLVVSDKGESTKVILARPTTFMNESGQAVGAIARFHSIPAEQVVVVHDELDLDLGRLRLKQGGGDNGHNGLRSIRAHLKTGDFHRVRLGIGRPPGGKAGPSWVLSKFNRSEQDQLAEALESAAAALTVLITEGLAAAQNKFNT
ncbi:aminoacyl-tRNA hydrolase [Parenemella sanctibonifatiensis]|uniref:Peptidyl-tRNA hydrolase n=1 Tax=Parenemella sanctibonifatiensis TaxID=2016505 RepID=A0A255EMZ6_9ACTN|nr:aminoacyl-tRNA hydrolase [Parenemella sanctibonifatiensis]OYN92351.1 aminoacyl-tRNA hydrolase [Parenemella sanctibonifatiensis]